MALRDWFSRRTPLQLALSRGLKTGGNMFEELGRLGDFEIKSETDGAAICEALKQVIEERPEDENTLTALIGLFQNVGGAECPAFDVLAGEGIDLLIDLVDRKASSASENEVDPLLYALKMAVYFGSEEGTDCVIRAARLPLSPDSFMWSVILAAYGQGHPLSQKLFEALSDPLPGDFLAISLLDCANAAAREGANWRHPFDSEEGFRMIEQWLSDEDEEHYSYAVSAAAALPFLTDPDPLVALGFVHPSPEVKLEAAWAAAKLGHDEGVEALVKASLDLNQSERAREYLKELGLSDEIPAEAEDPDFQAMSQFAQWLAHPNELARPPDELKIVQKMDLKWPPEYESKRVWLIEYTARDTTGLEPDDIGVGLVGSITFCFFGYDLDQRPPDDCIAIHCYWEMTCVDLIAETDVDESSSEYDRMLKQCDIPGLTEAKIAVVAELSPELKYPQAMVAVARAKCNDEAGWVVLDGPRSRWYAANEMPADSIDKSILMVHVGRKLLGFETEPDRRAYLGSRRKTRSPEEIVANFESLLLQARTDDSVYEKTLGKHGSMGKAFGDYAEAVANLRGQPLAQCKCNTYEEMLKIALSKPEDIRDDALDIFTPLGVNFDAYIDALTELDRQAEVPATIDIFRKHWDHNFGNGKLGAAAFRSGHKGVAEPFFVKIRNEMQDWCRVDEMADLAQIWLEDGRSEEAHTLVIDSLKGLLDQSRSATGSDRGLFEKWYRARVERYLQLFPDRGSEELKKQGLPESTMIEPYDPDTD